MSVDAPVMVLCNGASTPPNDSKEYRKKIVLSYLQQCDTPANVRIGLPAFVRSVNHLPDRVLDLLELAAYVYCADRMVSRGLSRAVEFHSWGRSFHFVIKVRDYDFWSRNDVSECLSTLLKFMTGDHRYSFSFQPGHSTPKSGLFDDERSLLEQSLNVSVMLFSGGLDSLAGVIQRLTDTEESLCLVSHQPQTGTARTQNRLVETLKNCYPGRINHYKFRSNLTQFVRRVEETQRSRSFLYTSIAYAIGQAFGQDRFFVYENGVTSINFTRRQNLSNARASRTTHPQAINRLQHLFTLIRELPIQIEVPFLWKTKTDVMEVLKQSAFPNLITSAVSCSKTYKNLGPATHCGGCSQCIDRRFAAYGARIDDVDEAGIYSTDIVTREISDGEARTTAVDYVRQAKNFSEWNVDHFFTELTSELSDLIDYLPSNLGEIETVDQVWNLCRRHGNQVASAMNRMRNVHENLYTTVEKNSLLNLISDREYLKDPVDRLVETLCRILPNAVGKMFSVHQPKNEPDLNVKISVLLDSHRTELVQEHPAVSFAGGHTVPDHGNDDIDVFLEAKYIRQSTTPSKASEGIAADLTKYPPTKHIVFVVYDPCRAIKDDPRFKRDLEKNRRSTVLLVR